VAGQEALYRSSAGDDWPKIGVRGDTPPKSSIMGLGTRIFRRTTPTLFTGQNQRLLSGITNEEKKKGRGGLAQTANGPGRQNA